MRLFSGIYGLARRQAQERMAWIVEMAGLRGYEDHRTGRLPMGVRQRLALGCALVHQPRVLFLDEPTSGVDPVGRRRFWELLTRLARQEQVAILITTHYLSEAEHCDRLALMYAGRIVAGGTPAQLKRDVEGKNGRLLEFVVEKPGPALVLLMAAGYNTAALFGKKIHVLSRDPADDEVRIRNVLSSSGISIERLRARPLSLEDVFVSRVMALEQATRNDSPQHSARPSGGP
jgi:ABC-2 type transport system ATP-binding protein